MASIVHFHRGTRWTAVNPLHRGVTIDWDGSFTGLLQRAGLIRKEMTTGYRRGWPPSPKEIEEADHLSEKSSGRLTGWKDSPGYKDKPWRWQVGMLERDSPGKSFLDYSKRLAWPEWDGWERRGFRLDWIPHADTCVCVVWCGFGAPIHYISLFFCNAFLNLLPSIYMMNTGDAYPPAGPTNQYSTIKYNESNSVANSYMSQSDKDGPKLSIGPANNPSNPDEKMLGMLHNCKSILDDLRLNPLNCPYIYFSN